MKRALRGALRGSSPSTRGRQPPPPSLAPAPDAGSRRTIVSAANQLSHLSQQRQPPLQQQQQQQQRWEQGFSSLSTKGVGRDPYLAPSARRDFAAVAGSTAARSRGRGRGGGRGDGGTRFGGGSPNSAVATAAAAAVAAAVAAAAGGKQADCDYPEGTRFGDVYYCSGKALGSGSFGTVCTAQHRVTGKVVAVKRIPRTRTPDLTFAEICWEVEVLKLAGEHRNVTQFHDIFEDDDYYYLTMELARGGELFDLLVENGTPDEAHTAALMKSLVEAVTFVHLHGIIHGDIKPENVFLTNSSTGDVDWEGVRLGDFGSAVEMVLGGGTTVSGMHTRGTVAYNPPESLRRMLDGKDAVVTTMGDVWALGVVLFMLLTGEHPFASDMSISDEEMAKRVLEMCDRDYGESTLFADREDDDDDDDDDEYEDGGGAGAGARSSVSPLARDLILKMLTPDPELRATPPEVLEHPWLKRAALGIKDRTQRTTDPRVHRQRHRINRYPRYGPPAPTNPEALQKFWSARRRLKACMLSLMCGLVDVEARKNTEEERLRAVMRLREDIEERRKKREAEAAAPPPQPPPLPPRGPSGFAGVGLPPELLAGLPGGQPPPPAVEDTPPTPENAPPAPEERPTIPETKGPGPEDSLSGLGEGPSSPSRGGRERPEAAVSAAAAAAAEEAGRKARIAAAEVLNAAFERRHEEAEGASEDRFMAMLTGSRFGLRPYAIGSREATCGIIDRGQKGYITRGDLENIMLAMGESLTESEITDMMRAVDGDPATESRRITYGEMVETVPPLCPPKKIKAGQTLYAEGQLDPTFYLLMKGSVEFSISSLGEMAGLQRQLPGASFGEVELLRSDELSTPRLATCTCIGQPSGGDCEVLVVTEHMFDLLTDTFKGVRSGLDLQREVRLTQLAEAVLTKVFHGEKASFDQGSVIWKQNGQETTVDWEKVAPIQGPLPPLWGKKPSPKSPPPTPVPPVSRPSRLRPPPPPASRSGALKTGTPQPSSAAVSEEDRRLAEATEAASGGGSGGGGGGDVGGRVRSSAVPGVSVEARSASGSTREKAAAVGGGGGGGGGREGEGKGSTEGMVAAAAAAAANSPAAGGPTAAAASTGTTGGDGGGGGGQDSEGSFVLLVLEGSIIADFGETGQGGEGDVEEKEEEEERGERREMSEGRAGGASGGDEVGDGGKPRRTMPPRSRTAGPSHGKDRRVLGKGGFIFCGKGFGDVDLQSPKTVSCPPGQTAKVLRVRAKDFESRMAKRNMVSLKEFMFAKQSD